ncbi:hypothetical protein EJ04DRAFT_451938, partial [Polyplosphaeria fusca]
ATGYGDLVVVLLEPSDKAERVEYHEMKASSTALQLVDETLTVAFAGQRDVDDTIILDRRPFRSAEIQDHEDEGTRKRNNQKAYHGFEAILAKLRPKVIVLCQCQDTVPHGELSDQWPSSISKAGRYDIVQLSNGHKCFQVNSFHPMYLQYLDGEEKPLKRLLSEYLFNATFVIAANRLAGRQLCGFGLWNLRNCAQHGPTLEVSETNDIWCSYPWVSERDFCVEEVLECLENVGVPR